MSSPPPSTTTSTTSTSTTTTTTEDHHQQQQQHWTSEETDVPPRLRSAWVALRILRHRVGRHGGLALSVPNSAAAARSRSRSSSRSPSRAASGAGAIAGAGGDSASSSSPMMSKSMAFVSADLAQRECELLVQWRPPAEESGYYKKRADTQFWMPARKVIGGGEDGVIEAQKVLRLFLSRGDPLKTTTTVATSAAAAGGSAAAAAGGAADNAAGGEVRPCLVATAELNASVGEVRGDEYKDGISNARAHLLLRDYAARIEQKHPPRRPRAAPRVVRPAAEQAVAAGGQDDVAAQLQEFYGSLPEAILKEVNAWRNEEMRRLNMLDVQQLRLQCEMRGIRIGGIRKAGMERLLLQHNMLARRDQIANDKKQHEWLSQYSVLSDLDFGSPVDELVVLSGGADPNAHIGERSYLLGISMGIRFEVWPVDSFSGGIDKRPEHAYSSYSDGMSHICCIRLCRAQDGSVFALVATAKSIRAYPLLAGSGRTGMGIAVCSFQEPNEIVAMDVTEDASRLIVGIDRVVREQYATRRESYAAELQLDFLNNKERLPLPKLKQLEFGPVVADARFFRTYTSVHSVTFSPVNPDEYVIVNDGKTSGAHLYDFGAELPRRSIVLERGLHGCRFAPDGESVVIQAEAAAMLYRLLDDDGTGIVGERERVFYHPNIRFASLTENGRFILQDVNSVSVFYVDDPSKEPLYRIMDLDAEAVIVILPQYGAQDLIVAVSRGKIRVLRTSEFATTKGGGFDRDDNNNDGKDEL